MGPNFKTLGWTSDDQIIELTENLISQNLNGCDWKFAVGHHNIGIVCPVERNED